jgi:hypothetical protein
MPWSGICTCWDDGVAMAVARHAFDVRVVLEVVHRQLVVPFEEAGRHDLLPQDALDTDRDLGFVDGLHQELPVRGLEDAGVVDAHAERARQRRLLVGVGRADLEQGIAPRHDAEHLLDAGGLRGPGCGRSRSGAPAASGRRRPSSPAPKGCRSSPA